MRWVYVYAGLIFLTSILPGCSAYNSLFKPLPLSENYALKAKGSISDTPEIIDGDREHGTETKFLPATRGGGMEEDVYTGVEVTLPEVKHIGEIRIYNDGLVRCEIKAHVPGSEDEWVLVRKIKKNISPLITIHPHGGVDTDKIRIMVRRTVRTFGGTSAGGGSSKSGFFIDKNPIIKEVELYKILKGKEIKEQEKK